MLPTPTSSGKRCPLCGALADEMASFCSQCGKPLQNTQTQPPAKVKWYYNVWFILVMLFVVLGPFGLPLVWKHPRFSRLTKGVLTLLVLLYTVWLVDMTIRASRVALEHLQQLDSSFQF